MSFETELLRVSGKWKKLQGLYVHVLSSYDDAWQQKSRVTLFGRRVGCKKSDLGARVCHPLTDSFKILLPGCPGAAGMLAMRTLEFCVLPVLAFYWIRPFTVPFWLCFCWLVTQFLCHLVLLVSSLFPEVGITWTQVQQCCTDPLALLK